MLRSNEIMDKVKAKLVEQATSKKAAAEARKLRDLKKFGKQVQVAKQQERAKEKKEALEKIKTLKRRYVRPAFYGYLIPYPGLTERRPIPPFSSILERQEGGSASLGANETDDLFDVAVDNELGDCEAA